jgi:hypothetical protein
VSKLTRVQRVCLPIGNTNESFVILDSEIRGKAFHQM